MAVTSQTTVLFEKFKIGKEQEMDCTIGQPGLVKTDMSHAIHHLTPAHWAGCLIMPVQQIEAGDLDGTTTRKILEDALVPMLAHGIDTVVLGCTHYPFVIPLIQEIVGMKVRVIDPAPAVAKQAIRLLKIYKNSVTGNGQGKNIYYTSGNKKDLKDFIASTMGIFTNVRKVNWIDGKIQ